MPRIYKRRTNKAAWTAETLQAALEAVNGGRALREVARAFSIPRGTLQDRIKSGNRHKPQLGRRPVFSQAQENELAEQVLNLSKIFFGVTRSSIMRSAYIFASLNNIKNPFSKNRLAGRDWLDGFLRRNPQLSLRKPEAISLSRITAFNKEEVSIFYKNLAKLMEKHKFVASRIYNADETGITTVQRPAKVYAKKGEKRVGSVTSWEKGKTTTAMCAFSASGVYIPPMFIFARKRMADHLTRNGPPGAIYHCSDNGWITEDLFIEWLRHFAQVTKPSEDDPVLLIFDNHVSHCSLRAYNYCKENSISVLTIPPHTSHRVQPLDVTFFGPLKAAYNVECDKYMRNNPGQKITPNIVAELFNKAFGRVATVEKATKGFEVTGICPMNPDIFSEDDFAAAENLNHTETPDVLIVQQEIEVEKQTNDEETGVSFNEILTTPGPSTSNNSVPQTTRGKKQHSQIFTSSPMKDILEEKENKKKKRSQKNTKNEIKVKKVRKQVFGASQEKTIDTQVKKTREPRKNIKRKNYRVNNDENDTSDEDLSEDVGINKDICLICGEFGKNGEYWLECTTCHEWAHKACTDGGSSKKFICDFCS